MQICFFPVGFQGPASMSWVTPWERPLKGNLYELSVTVLWLLGIDPTNNYKWFKKKKKSLNPGLKDRFAGWSEVDLHNLML